MINKTEEILESLKTNKGGYNQETLRLIGVPWPPPSGWKKDLIARDALNAQPTATG